MLIPRAIAKDLKVLLRQFPVVCILGPRQAGKTTLAKMALPKADYWDLERPSDRQVLEMDPEGSVGDNARSMLREIEGSQD